MKLSPESCRRLLLICAVMIGCVALMLAVGVIGPVTAEVARGGTPQNAVVAFWVNIAVGFLSALAVFVIAKRSHGLNRLAKARLVIVGIIVMFLGFVLADAASAYLGHGPEMRSASIVLILCAVADFLGGVAVVVMASLCPGPRSSAEA